MVSLAGLNTSVESTARGIQIDVNGFSDKIELVAEDTLRKIKSIEINEERFKSYIQEISKSFENFKLQPEFRQASFWLSYLIKKNTFTNKQLLDELKRIKLQEVNSFIPKLYEKIKIEGLLYGNSNSSEIMPLLNKVHEILGAKILEDENLIIEEDIKYPPGTKIFEFPSNGNNNVWYGYYQLGARDIKLNAQMRVLGSIINSEFYSEMRTNQQLGYIVYSGYDYASKSYGFSFLIQSSTHKAKELEQRALKWIGLIDQLVANFPDEKFEKIKQIISNEILLPEKNMKEKMIWLTTEAFVLKGDFDYRKNFAKEILNLEKEKLLTDIKKLFIENPTLLSIFVGKNFKMPMKIQELKEKLPSYK